MWNDFSKTKPTKDGWYIVTVEIKGQQRYVRELYWKSGKQAFWDNIRQNEDDIFKKEIKRDHNLTDMVVAWMEEPEAYMDGFVLYDIRVIQI